MVEAGDFGTGHGVEFSSGRSGGVVDDGLEDGFVGHETSTGAYASAIENQDRPVRKENSIRHCLRTVG